MVRHKIVQALVMVKIVYIYVYVRMQHTLCECMYAVQPSLTLYDMHQVLYMK